MGAYTFADKPPFRILRRSMKPFFAKHFYVTHIHRTVQPPRVVFPGGYVTDKNNNFAWVVFGRQDCDMWVTKIDVKGLLESLVPV